MVNQDLKAELGLTITPESWRGSPKVNFLTRQWFSKVESANIGAFE